MRDESTTNRPTIAISFKDFRDEEIVDFFANENRSFHPEHFVSGKDSRSRVVGSPHFSCKRKPTAAFRTSFGIHAEPAKNVVNEDESILIRVSNSLSEDEPIIRVARGSTPKAMPKEPRKKTIESAFGKAAKPLGALAMFGRVCVPQENERAARVVSDPLEIRISTTKRRKKASGVQLHPFSVAGRAESRLDQVSSIGSHPSDRPLTENTTSSCVKISPETIVHDPCTATVPNGMVSEKTDSESKPFSAEASLLSSLHNADQCLKRLIESWGKLPLHMKETIAALVEVSEGNL